MSFYNSSPGDGLWYMGGCAPDIETQAEQLKEKLAVTAKLKTCLMVFSEFDMVSDFRDINSFAELLGGVTLTKVSLTEKYARLLKQIEAK